MMFCCMIYNLQGKSSRKRHDVDACLLLFCFCNWSILKYCCLSLEYIPHTSTENIMYEYDYNEDGGRDPEH
jgi:hypothetical protein